jgi:50S ribosomal subunit-associated GTPase HflX
VDASSPHASEHTAHVMATLQEIGADTTPQILVLNKVDQVRANRTPRRWPGESSKIPTPPAGACDLGPHGHGLQALLTKIDEALRWIPSATARSRFPPATVDPFIRCTSTRASFRRVTPMRCA